jgi:hypothetical protein
MLIGVIGHAVWSGFQVVLAGLTRSGLDQAQLAAAVEGGGPPPAALIVIMLTFLIGFFLDLIAAGKNNQEIAARLFLSLKTVRNYVSNIFTKLQVADRAQAIIRAREAGLGDMET